MVLIFNTLPCVSVIIFIIWPSVLLLHFFASVVAKLLSSDIPLQLFVFVITYVLLVSMVFIVSCLQAH